MTKQTSMMTLALTFIASAASTPVIAGSKGHDMSGHDMSGHTTPDAGREHAMDAPGMPTGMSDGMTSGDVVAVDREKRRLTLKHERIESHGMPGMTMPFPVGSDVDLDALNPGDHVRFRLKEGTMMIDKLEPPR